MALLHVFRLFNEKIDVFVSLAHPLLSPTQELKTYHYDQEISIWISHSWRILEL